MESINVNAELANHILLCKADPRKYVVGACVGIKRCPISKFPGTRKGNIVGHTACCV